MKNQWTETKFQIRNDENENVVIYPGLFELALLAGSSFLLAAPGAGGLRSFFPRAAGESDLDLDRDPDDLQIAKKGQHPSVLVVLLIFFCYTNRKANIPYQRMH